MAIWFVVGSNVMLFSGVVHVAWTRGGTVPRSTPRARRTDVTFEEIADEVVVYDLIAKKAHCLNRTAAAVFRLADGTRSTAELAQALADEVGVPSDEALVEYCLEQLDRQELLDDV